MVISKKYYVKPRHRVQRTKYYFHLKNYLKKNVLLKFKQSYLDGRTDGRQSDSITVLFLPIEVRNLKRFKIYMFVLISIFIESTRGQSWRTKYKFK